MTEIGPAAQPLVVFVPPGLGADEVVLWRREMLTELSEAGVVDDQNRELWESALDETGSMELPSQASGLMLLVTHSTPPIYIWVTLAQPANNPLALGEAILDTQFPEYEHADPVALAEATVAQGYRIGRRRTAGGTEVFVQVSVTVATLTIEGVGETDVCLWFVTDQLEAVDDLLPVVAKLMHDPDLATYLAA